MSDTPIRRETRKIILEWAIPTPCDAKTFALGLHLIHQEMEQRGVDLSFDDAYRVAVGDDEVRFFFEVVVS